MWGRKLTVEGVRLDMFFSCQCKRHTFEFILFKCKTFDFCQPGELDRKPQWSADLLAWKPQSKALLFQGLAKLWSFDVERLWARRTQNGMLRQELLFSEEEKKVQHILYGIWPRCGLLKTSLLGPGRQRGVIHISPITIHLGRGQLRIPGGGSIPKVKDPC